MIQLINTNINNTLNIFIKKNINRHHSLFVYKYSLDGISNFFYRLLYQTGLT